MKLWAYSMLPAFLGCMFPFFLTSLGASLVFFISKKKEAAGGWMLGFAVGVMLAASVWSLLLPSISQAQETGQIPIVPAAGGFAAGALCLLLFDGFLERRTLSRIAAANADARVWGRLSRRRAEGAPQISDSLRMLIAAVTIHNVPEGMAVGLAFAMAAEAENEAMFASAAALALGIGIQNFPEGAAVSLPLGQGGMKKWRAFLLGSLSGAVEPAAGVLTALIAGRMQSLLPWFLSFAAGVMVFVCCYELIPELHSPAKSKKGTLGIVLGFLIMMTLDVTLG